MKRLHRMKCAWVAIALAALTSCPASAYSFGSGTCDALADGSFMSWKQHHPGSSGGFVLALDHADYYSGETLRLHLTHPDGELLIGFLLYAQDTQSSRRGLFTPVAGTTMTNLPAACANVGHTLTHDLADRLPRARSELSLAWTAPPASVGALQFRGLVLRADPFADDGTDFYELVLHLPAAVDGVFRSDFDSVP